MLQAMKRDCHRGGDKKGEREIDAGAEICLAREGMRRLTPPNIRLHSQWCFAVNDLTRSTL